MSHEQIHTIDVLNQLYAAEMQGVLPRLTDLQISASPGNAAQALPLRRVAAQSLEHREWLVEALDAADGALWPASMDVSTAMLHYLSVRTILPMVIHDIERRLEAYDRAAQSRPLLPEAVGAISRISRRYSDTLAQLRSLAPAGAQAGGAAAG